MLVCRRWAKWRWGDAAYENEGLAEQDSVCSEIQDRSMQLYMIRRLGRAFVSMSQALLLEVLNVALRRTLNVRFQRYNTYYLCLSFLLIVITSLSVRIHIASCQRGGAVKCRC